ncbi:MAG: helix-turn-helix transcriptional regulator [Campylobacteraceae bacterium]|nr:helix-turn-helix transcriptional regulator [Campylobacteraceae bacterium]
MEIKLSNISFCHYIQKEPQVKTEVYIKNNILIFVRKGTKLIHLHDKTLNINENSILFLRSGNYLMSEVLDEYYEAMLFLYEDSLLLDFINKYNIQPKKTLNSESNIFKIDDTPDLKTMIDATCTYFTSDILNKEEIIKLKLEEAFLNILNSSSKIEFTNLLASIYESNYFKIQVEKEFSYEDNILDLALKFKLPTLSFRLKFKDVFKTTPKKWQVNKRLEKAKVLLESTSKNVSEVCILSGFDNLSWFIQVFKKKYNKTPKEIKNNNN